MIFVIKLALFVWAVGFLLDLARAVWKGLTFWE